jgi:hypothetical protein
MIIGLPRRGHDPADHESRLQKQPVPSGGTMTQQSSDHEPRSNDQTADRSIPAFKPVALPALAAAVRATKRQPGRPKTSEPPAILRKEVMPG